MKYESNILERLIKTYGVVGNPKYVSEIIKQFIIQGKECYPNLFTYQSDWLAHIDEFGLNPSYTVRYTGQSIYAPNTLERPVKSAILKGSTKYRDIDTGEVLDAFEDGRNLELVSVEMPVLTTTGKNLFDKEAFYNDWKSKVDTYVYKEIVDNEEVLKINNFHHLFNDNDGFRINVKKGVPLTVRMECKKAGTKTTNTLFIIRYGDDVYKGFPACKSDEWQTNTTTFVPTRDYITFCSGYNNDGYYYVKNIQLEESSVATSYEPYKSNILSVSEDIELRGIGNVRDELNCLTGEMTQRIGEVVLDGSEDWRLNNSNTGTNTIIPYLDNYFTKQTKMIMAEFPRYSGSSIWQGKIVDYECYLDNAETIAIRINKDKLVTADINGFKQWLSQNPVTIQYQLATESIKTVELNIKDQNNQVVNHLTSFEGGTHFDTSSQTGSVLPTLEVDVVVDLEETIMVCSTEGNTM